MANGSTPANAARAARPGLKSDHRAADLAAILLSDPATRSRVVKMSLALGQVHAARQAMAWSQMDRLESSPNEVVRLLGLLAVEPSGLKRLRRHESSQASMTPGLSVPQSWSQPRGITEALASGSEGCSSSAAEDDPDEA